MGNGLIKVVKYVVLKGDEIHLKGKSMQYVRSITPLPKGCYAWQNNGIWYTWVRSLDNKLPAYRKVAVKIYYKGVEI